MAFTDSVSVIFFTNRLAPVIHNDPTSASMAPSDTSLMPGCRISKAPQKPIMIAIIRRIRMISPRNIAAPSVIKSGQVKLSAVTSASGINVTAVKPAAIPTKLTMPRYIKRRGRTILMVLMPDRKMRGKRHNAPRKFRKNTTSMTGIVCDAKRINTPITVKNNMAASISNVACHSVDSRLKACIKARFLKDK